MMRLVLFAAVCWSVSSREIFPVCRPGSEFWSTEKAACNPCTKCAPEFTVSPCAVHKDAICGPLSALELDWSFLSTRRKPETGQRIDGSVTSKMLWRFPQPEEQRRMSPEAHERAVLEDSVKAGQTGRTFEDDDEFRLDDDFQVITFFYILHT